MAGIERGPNYPYILVTLEGSIIHDGKRCYGVTAPFATRSIVTEQPSGPELAPQHVGTALRRTRACGKVYARGVRFSSGGAGI